MMLIMILTRPRSHVSCCDYNIDDFIQIFCANMCCVWWNTDNINIPAGLNVDAIFNVDNGLNIGFNVDTPSRPQMKLQMLRSPLCARVDGEIRGNTGKYGEIQGNTGKCRQDGEIRGDTGKTGGNVFVADVGDARSLSRDCLSHPGSQTD